MIETISYEEIDGVIGIPVNLFFTILALRLNFLEGLNMEKTHITSTGETWDSWFDEKTPTTDFMTDREQPADQTIPTETASSQ